MKSVCVWGWPITPSILITEKKTQAVNCNCINKSDCRLSNQCQVTNIKYKAKVTSNLRNYHRKIYYGNSKGTFKHRHRNYKKSFNHKKHRTYTELSREYWRLKTQRTASSTILYFKKMPTNKKNRYLLFMFERKTVYH